MIVARSGDVFRGFFWIIPRAAAFFGILVAKIMPRIHRQIHLIQKYRLHTERTFRKRESQFNQLAGSAPICIYRRPPTECRNRQAGN